MSMKWNAEVQAELRRRGADVARRNGIELDDIIQTYKRVMLADITKVLGPPDTWDPETKMAVRSYDEGDPESGRKVRLYDKLKAAETLWDRLFPGQGASKPPEQAGSNATVNVDKLMMLLRSPLPAVPAGRVIDGEA
jgi:hypothetical protein